MKYTRKIVIHSKNEPAKKEKGKLKDKKSVMDKNAERKDPSQRTDDWKDNWITVV